MQLLWWCPSECADTLRHQFWEMGASTASRLLPWQVHQEDWHSHTESTVTSAQSKGTIFSQWENSWVSLRLSEPKAEEDAATLPLLGSTAAGKDQTYKGWTTAEISTVESLKPWIALVITLDPTAFSEHFSLLCQHLLRRYTILD